jgi:tetratricopeptide (TPR) repeat protein
LAEVLKKQGRLDEAEQQYRLAISRFPRNVVAKCGLAEVLKEQGRLDEAEEQYRTSVATFPNDAVAQCGLAEVLKQQGRLDKAEDAYRQAHDRWPRNRVARNGLANLLRTRHRFAEALALLPEPMELRTRADFVDLHLVGMIQLGMGSIDAATRIFRSGRDNARWKEERSYFASALVVARLRQERYDEALADLEGLENAQPQVATLRLHALAGRRDESRVRPLHEDLDSRFLTFQPPVQASLKLIESAFGLDRPGAIRRPTADEVTAIAGAEIEMLLAA